MDSMRVHRNQTAHLRDGIGAMSIDEGAFVEFIQGDSLEAFKEWREAYMAKHEVLEFVEDLGEYSKD